MAELTALQYRAFISYSHADTSWAKWLHRALLHQAMAAFGPKADTRKTFPYVGS